MTSCDGVRLPREREEHVFHGPRGGIDESVMANGMENVPPGGHTSTVDTSKQLLCRFALCTINEQCISDLFHAVPAAPAVSVLSQSFIPVLLAGTPYLAPVVTGMYAGDEWEVVEVARGPVDPLWRNNVMEYACTRLYNGANVDKSYPENEFALRLYQRQSVVLQVLVQGQFLVADLLC
jgi:hypothetical protein